VGSTNVGWVGVRDIKDDECGIMRYKGRNLADQVRYYVLKEVIKDDECGWCKRYSPAW
jgi:hypothetical protein